MPDDLTRRLHMSSEVDDIVTPDEERASTAYRCLGCAETWPCPTIRALDGEVTPA